MGHEFLSAWDKDKTSRGATATPIAGAPSRTTKAPATTSFPGAEIRVMYCPR